ncbi:catalase [Fusarium austroafricanum]|uniref:Catalase n=1 Tax=Fusarium austroafricanum TaxID=2364996 RepID=A0A8H4NV64_9HYPO|nr:catalase [Fusarium austroafricanum]
MTGSRKTLQEILDTHYMSNTEAFDSEKPSEALESKSEDDIHIQADEGETSFQRLDNTPGFDNANQEEPETQETVERQRFNSFEKNTFRQPKFWLSWRGRLLVSPTSDLTLEQDSDRHEIQSGMGYLVFTGNKCQKFHGIISCDVLGWKDVALNGWKR